MRPLELKLRNFRSYFGDDAVFDLRRRSLVGVVGPIGSGKSSMLDAVAFALYGRTPAGGTATKALIHQRAEHGAVQLRFEVEGEVWEVVRTLRRSSAGHHALYRYQTDDPQAEAVEKIVLEAEVNEKIKELLGLDYDAFGRSVMLAQGRFSEFLTSGATSRDTVLKGVFGHDRLDHMRTAARERSAVAAAELSTVTVRVEQLERVAARLEATLEMLAQVDDRVERLRKAEPQVADLDGRIATASADRDAARQRLESLAPHVDRLPDGSSVATLLEQAATVEGRRRRLADELETARTALLAAERRLGELHESGEMETLDEAAELLAATEPRRKAVADTERRLDTLASRLAEQRALEEKTTTELGVATNARSEAEHRLAEAEANLLSAREAHHRAQHGDMAASLRRELADGDSCPVCLRRIDTLPTAPPAEALEEAMEKVTSATTARAVAESARTEAAISVAEMENTLRSLAESCTGIEEEIADGTGILDAARTELEEGMARLAELLGEGEPATVVDERRRRHAALVEDAAEGRRKLDQVRSEHDQAIRDEQEVAKRVAALRLDIVELATRLDFTVDVADDDPATLRIVVDDLRTAWNEYTEAAQQVMRRGDDAIAGAEEERRTLLGSLEVDGDLGAAIAAAEARSGHLAEEVTRHRAEVDASADLLAESARLTASKARYDRIASDLTDSKFVRYLLDDERARLAALGSEHFMRLSSGRYRFTEDGKFAIVDLTAADAVRNASSLSGGETFLASLALALALAEMVTRTGGRLDAFFLDEGFGSLDPEHLDLAMEGIEALVADDSSRLVVVVSHVPEMRHRIEDLIELDRHPLTGDTEIITA